MNGVVIENSDEFEALINSFENSTNKIKDIFNNEKNEIEKINSTDVWSGDTQKVIYDKNKMLQENFDPIVEALDYYVLFMKKVVSDYKAFENKTNQNAEVNSDELNVN